MNEFRNDGTVRNATGGIVGLWSGNNIRIDPDELTQPVTVGINAVLCRKCCRIKASPGATCLCEGYEPDLSKVERIAVRNR